MEPLAPVMAMTILCIPDSFKIIYANAKILENYGFGRGDPGGCPFVEWGVAETCGRWGASRGGGAGGKCGRMDDGGAGCG